MALQDIQPYPISTAYPYGSPQYLAQILPLLESQLQAQSERADAARGTLYGGASMANEQQAAEELMGNMAQEGAQQALQQQTLQEQQAFQAQEQAAQNQANAQLAAEQGAAQEKAAEKQGLYGGLGSIGGLYAAKELGLFGGPGAPTVGGNEMIIGGPGTSPAAVASAENSDIAALESQGFSPAQASSMAASSYVPGAAIDAPASATPWYESSIPGAGGLNAADLGAGAAGGYLGYNIGGGAKSGAAPELGGGLGGLGGMYAASLIPGAGPVTMGLGALAGSALGRQAGNFFSHLF